VDLWAIAKAEGKREAFWVEAQAAGVGERRLDGAHCPCVGIWLNGSKATMTTVYFLSMRELRIGL
jgi:hypothetical protein